MQTIQWQHFDNLLHVLQERRYTILVQRLQSSDIDAANVYNERVTGTDLNAVQFLSQYANPPLIGYTISLPTCKNSFSLPAPIFVQPHSGSREITLRRGHSTRNYDPCLSCSDGQRTYW